MSARLVMRDLQREVGVKQDGLWGPKTREATLARLTNRKAPAVTHADLVDAAQRLGVTVAHIRAIRAVEAPRGPFDSRGLPAMLYERHVFSRNSDPRGRFNRRYPNLSANVGFGPGGYGPYDQQVDKLLAACGLDVEAAFSAVSWGAFQILGENARVLGYASPLAMAVAFTESEAGQLDGFVRFVQVNGLGRWLAACKPGDPASCVPFVQRYNGLGYAVYGYHTKLAEELERAWEK